MKRRNIWIVIGIVVIAVVVYILQTILQSPIVGYVKSSLDPQFLPTAEFLMNNPTLDRPDGLEISPPAGSTISRSEPTIYASLEFGLKPRIYGSEDTALAYTVLFINEQQVGVDDVKRSSDRMLPGHSVIEFDTSKLSPGLHLFRIQIAWSQESYRNPDPKLSYEWAYHVD